MENRFLLCCHDSLLVGNQSECDRFSCQEGKQSSAFNLYFHKANNEYFYCINREQLGQFGYLWLKIEILIVLVDVINALFLRKCQMF